MEHEKEEEDTTREGCLSPPREDPGDGFSGEEDSYPFMVALTRMLTREDVSCAARMVEMQSQLLT